MAKEERRPSTILDRYRIECFELDDSLRGIRAYSRVCDFFPGLVS